MLGLTYEEIQRRAALVRAELSPSELEEVIGLLTANGARNVDYCLAALHRVRELKHVVSEIDRVLLTMEPAGSA